MLGTLVAFSYIKFSTSGAFRICRAVRNFAAFKIDLFKIRIISQHLHFAGKCVNLCAFEILLRHVFDSVVKLRTAAGETKRRQAIF
jgi:hypothetical protein